MRTPHIATPPLPLPLNKKHRGSYNCGRCGLPKRGHICPDSSSPAAPPPPPPPPPPPRPSSHLRRALSFEDDDCSRPEPVLEAEDLCESGYVACMWEVLRRLPPSGLAAASGVCREWRDTARRLWRATEELKLRVPKRAQLGFVGSVIQKCPGLVRLSLSMESDVDATILACIAFSCPNLESMEINTYGDAVNRITGDELGRFVADKRCLTRLKMEGCSNLGGFVLSSSSLSTLSLSELFSLSKMVFNCPNLKEISMNFTDQENDTTDLVAAVDSLGRLCPKLQSIHIASHRLSHSAVLALTAANLRGLRMLSLVLGAEISDASVAAIASSFSKLEYLDLSGSSISDSGIGMICNLLPGTLLKLLLALCPNITSSGIQFATAQLPLLELMDCGMTLCEPSSESQVSNESDDFELPANYRNKLHLIYQKLIIKHARLKKLSLWGCCGLDALYLNCPHLNDINLNSCKNLHPERLLLQCPKLETVDASGCHKMLIRTLQSQVCDNFESTEYGFQSKRLPDGSKRIRLLPLPGQQVFDEDRKRRRMSAQPCNVIVDSNN